MRRFSLTITFALLMGVANAGCGGDSSLPDPGPSSSLDPSTRLVDLSEADVITLCDWTAGRFGGYGQGVTCSDGLTVSARQSRELCVMDYRSASSTCSVTVGDIQTCTNQAVGPPVCATVPQACFAILTCL
jgi:hypothetical protein